MPGGTAGKTWVEQKSCMAVSNGCVNVGGRWGLGRCEHSRLKQVAKSGPGSRFCKTHGFSSSLNVAVKTYQFNNINGI